MKEKQCSTCKLIKPITDFWKNKQHPDGYNYTCRVCYRLIDRKRYYKNYELNREKRNQKSMRGDKKYPEKNKARRLLVYAVRMGRVLKLPCEVCGVLQTEGHHQDYTKPLEVNWVCKLHHHEKYHRKYNTP